MAVPPRQNHRHPSGDYDWSFLCSRDIDVDGDNMKVREIAPIRSAMIGVPNIPPGSIDGSGLKYRP
jgi:hypothetical protein